MRWLLVGMLGCVSCGSSSPDPVDAAAGDASVADAAIDAGIVCSEPLPCAAPSGVGGDEVCVSGRILDGQSWQAISEVTAQEVEVALYDALMFLSDATTPPFKRLTAASGGVDRCGRFSTRFSVSQDTPNLLLILSVVGASTAPLNKYVQTAVLVAANPNMNIPVKALFALSAAQDAAWSAQAGLAIGTTFAKSGSIAMRYRTASADPQALFPGTPIAGITPKWMDVVDPAVDHFFTDASAASATTIGPTLSATGTNGIAMLVVGQAIGSAFAVTGSNSCTKSNGTPGTLTTAPETSGSTPGVILFADHVASCD